MADDQNKTTNSDVNNAVDEDTFDQNQPVTQVTDAVSPAVAGGQSVSGSDPDPESDDDTLENVHAAGFQVDEDLEHPQELDAARDIDEAEKEILES